MPLNDVPLSTQSLAQTQVPIRSNFSTINDGFSVDHETFNSGPNVEGKHNKVTFLQQAAAPIAIDTEIQMYSLNNGTSMQSELYLRRFGTVGDGIPFTLGQISGVPRGYTYLPSGMLINYGNDNLDIAAGTPIIFPRPYTGTTTYTLIINLRSQGGGQYLTTWQYGIDGTTFTASISRINGAATGTVFASWIAIGA